MFGVLCEMPGHSGASVKSPSMQGCRVDEGKHKKRPQRSKKAEEKPKLFHVWILKLTVSTKIWWARHLVQSLVTYSYSSYCSDKMSLQYLKNIFTIKETVYLYIYLVYIAMLERPELNKKDQYNIKWVSGKVTKLRLLRFCSWQPRCFPVDVSVLRFKICVVRSERDQKMSS